MHATKQVDSLNNYIVNNDSAIFQLDRLAYSSEHRNVNRKGSGFSQIQMTSGNNDNSSNIVINILTELNTIGKEKEMEHETDRQYS